jgi:hypothetical protein
MGHIELFSGNFLNLTAPRESDIHLEDIAQGLSNICRFHGQTATFYSVAQHCVLVSMTVPAHLKLQALLYHAPAAYLGDIPAPLKSLLPSFIEIESRIESVIAKKFNLPMLTSNVIRTADLLIEATEKRDLVNWIKNDGDAEYCTKPSPSPSPGKNIVPLTPKEAKILFLSCFEVYSILQARKSDQPENRMHTPLPPARNNLSMT